MFSIVVAMDKNRGIGLNGQLPWKLCGDIRFFKELTTCSDQLSIENRYLFQEKNSDLISWEAFNSQLKPTTTLQMPNPNLRNAVIMGRNTWDSLPVNFKPLPGRLNGVLSQKTIGEGEGTRQIFSDFNIALQEYSDKESIAHVYVIGGAQVYREALVSTACQRIYVTQIAANFACDVFFPEIPHTFQLKANGISLLENSIPYKFERWEHI